MNKCGDGKSCAGGGDCRSGVCTAGKCAMATCGDGVKNGAESDADCGGGMCPACGGGRACLMPADCVSGACTMSICARRIYVTNSTYNGNLGGVAGADAKCQNDGARPMNSAAVKALLVDSAQVGRRASTIANAGNGQVDWVLKASAPYVRVGMPPAVLIGTTSVNALFRFPLTNSFRATAGDAWTGLKNDLGPPTWAAGPGRTAATPTTGRSGT